MENEKRIPVSTVIKAVSGMSLSELEQIKDALVKRELYFQKFQGGELREIVKEFKTEGYSKEFLSDLEEGLKKSSPFSHEN